MALLQERGAVLSHSTAPSMSTPCTSRATQTRGQASSTTSTPQASTSGQVEAR